MSIAGELLSAELTPAERALRDSLIKPEFRDVHLYAFSRRSVYPDGYIKIGHPLAVLAIGSILKDSEHFAKLLTSGFAESQATPDPSAASMRQYTLPDEYDYESDSDLDEFEEVEEAPTPGGSEVPAKSSGKGKGKSGEEEEEQAGPDVSVEPKALESLPKHQILLPSVAHRTLCACVFFLYTGKVNFLPLRSAGAAQKQFAVLTAGDGKAPLCSPKSMYRLAESYGITNLQDLAYDAILARLTPANIVEEAFSRFFARYDRLREHAVSYLSRNYCDPKVQASLQDVLDKVLIGQSPHAGPLLRSLLGLRIATAPPSQGSNPDRPSVTPPIPSNNTGGVMQPISSSALSWGAFSSSWGDKFGTADPFSFSSGSVAPSHPVPPAVVSDSASAESEGGELVRRGKKPSAKRAK